MSTPAAAAAPAIAPLAPEAPARWLQVGRVFDGSEILQDAHLVYDAGAIRHVGTTPPAELLRPGQTEPDAVLPHHTALPGLIDAHTHLFLEGGELSPETRAAYLLLPVEELLRRATARLERLVRLGVLAVREAGDKHGIGSALQARYRSAERGVMPYLDAPAAAIHHHGRYGSFMSQPLEEHVSVEACVAARLADGAHRIKLIATGIINFEKGAVTAKPQMPAEELTRFADAARARHRQTMVHCSGADGVENCLAARVDSIEHGYFITADQLARLRDLDLAWVPTLAPVQFQVDHAAQLGWSQHITGNLQRILDGHAASLAQGAALGVRIVAGSDAGSHGVAHGWGFLYELELMQRAGLSARQVLHAATEASAARLGYAEPIGVLRSGAKARFILTAHPVLDDVRALREPRTVVFDGAVHTAGDSAGEPGL
jgi:imidazolonepropionase-like amidohydrolase